MHQHCPVNLNNLNNLHILFNNHILFPKLSVALLFFTAESLGRSSLFFLTRLSKPCSQTCSHPCYSIRIYFDLVSKHLNLQKLRKYLWVIFILFYWSCIVYLLYILPTYPEFLNLLDFLLPCSWFSFLFCLLPDNFSVQSFWICFPPSQQWFYLHLFCCGLISWQEQLTGQRFISGFNSSLQTTNGKEINIEFKHPVSTHLKSIVKIK